METRKLDVDRLIGFIIGTPYSLEDGLKNFGVEEISQKDKELIHSRISRCAKCGWWDHAEKIDNDTCLSCLKKT